MTLGESLASLGLQLVICEMGSCVRGRPRSVPLKEGGPGRHSPSREVAMLVFGRLLKAGKGQEQQVVHPEPPGRAARPGVFGERAPYLSSPFILR